MVSRGAMDAGILPVKRLDRAKSRLEEAFGPAGRISIARALVEDALELCRRVEVLRWWVVSDDDEVLDRAARYGFGAVRDRGAGLNQALELAIAEVVAAGAGSATIVPADVPLTAPEDLIDLVDTGATSDVVVVPSRPGDGTNGLHLRPPGVVAPEFGPGSLLAHAEAARVRGLRCSILPLDRMRLDIDTPADVEVLLDSSSDSRAARVVAELRSRAT
jgi:2-phospho-L-lactate/phosphoenolpyruvate guanylyltransferase